MSLGASNRRRVLLATAALLIAALMALPGWTPTVTAEVGGGPAPAFAFSANVRVDHGPRNATTPTLAVDLNAKLHVAWSDDRDGYRRLYYTNSTDAGSSWSMDREIDGAVGSTANDYDPAIAVDRSGGPMTGSVYVAWREYLTRGNILLRRSSDGGATWLPRVQVDASPPGTAVTAPAVTVDGSGVVYVAWSDTRTGTGLQVFVRRSADGGATWSTEVQVSQSVANAVMTTLSAVGGTVYMAWRELNAATLDTALLAARSTDGGATWTLTGVDAGPTPTDRQSPQVYAAQDGTVQLVWVATDAAGTPSIRSSRSMNGGAAWSPPARVDDSSTAPLTYRTPHVASAGGDLYAVWSDTRNGDPDIFATVSRDGGATWGDGVTDNDVRVDDTDRNMSPWDDATNQTAPVLASDGFSLFAVWTDDRDGAGLQLYFARYASLDVRITEIQDAPNGSEAVEVAAYGGAPIPLAGYRLDVDGVSWDLSPLGTLVPGDHRVVGDPASADLMYDLTLGDEGGVLRLIDGTGAVVDAVAYGQRGPVPDPIAGESVSRHWTGLKYSDDWTRSAVPTWHSQNGVPATASRPPVVLNEILFNPVAPTDAFIELFYGGNASADLAGYTVAANAAYAIPAGTVSAADPYFILKAADAPALFAGLGRSADNVYLYNATGSLQDMAGWSTPHTTGGAMARVPEGVGGHAGFDDPTSIAAGWRFDRTATIPLVVLRQDQAKDADLGQTASYPLTVLHKESAPDVLELEHTPVPSGWAVTFVDNATGAPLSDTDGDGLPDTGLLAPGTVFRFDANVQVPSVGPVADVLDVNVTAKARSMPLAQGTVTLTTGTFPRIEPSASVDRDPVYVVGSPPGYITDTNVTLTITGRGSARVRREPQDTVLLLDRSGSLADTFCPGCFTLLKEAAKTYVANLTIPDQAAVIYFREFPIPKGPLTTNYAQVMADIDSETAPGGGTQIGEAIQAANSELATDGNPSHFWAIILLTDGQDNPGGLDPMAEARISAGLGIRIFTIGLGPDADAVLLGSIAAVTGGQYLHADRAQDLAGIYSRIGTLIDNLAGFDSDLTDDIPMLEVTLPPYIVVPAGPFTDPSTGGARAPSWRGTSAAGTVLQWNVSALHVNESWSVRFPIRSTLAGVVDVLVVPDSRAEYQRWDGLSARMPFPHLPLVVLEVTKVRVTVTRSPLAGAVDVDGASYPAPASFSWYPGEVHDLSVPTTDPFGPNSRYLLQGWDDGGAPSHAITVGPTDSTITAVFRVQHRPTVNLIGTSGAHDVGVNYTAAGVAVSARAFHTWSEWVDQGHSLSFDRLAAGSGPDERWITEEDFTVLPWIAVTAPFTRDVVYWHQFMLRVTTEGLVPEWPAPLASTAFGRTTTRDVSTAWAGWIDEGSDAGIAGIVQVSARERYRTPDPVTWKGNRPQDVLVRYVHEMKPIVVLAGTDDRHVVGVNVHAHGGNRRADGLSGSWSDWVEVGSTLAFDNGTTGAPARKATDPTGFQVQTPFNATIRYAAAIETNLKPFFSAVYVAVLIAIGAEFAWRWPIPFAGRRRRDAERPGDVKRRVARDRRKTALLVIAPVAVLEAAIGITSYFTGVFRIPDQGVWLSMGLTVNTVILAAGIGGQLVARSRGYDAEKELARAAGAQTSGAGVAAPPAPPEDDD